MLAVALLCCLALVQGATVPDHEPYAADDDHDDEDDHIQERLHDLDDHMNQLIHKMQTVHDEFDHKVHEREAAQLKALNLKLRLAKGDHVCKKGFFRCHSAEDQCVSDMLVCDGEKDCHDGSDEDEHTCRNPFEGYTLEAKLYYFRCTRGAHLVPIQDLMTPLSFTPLPGFTSFAEVNMAARNKMKMGDTMITTGISFKTYYSFGAQLLVGYVGSQRDDVHFTCDVTPDDDVFMTCKSYVSNIEEPCAESVWIKAESKEGDAVQSAFSSVSNTYGLDLVASWN